MLCLCAALLAAAQRPVAQAPPGPSGSLYGSLFGGTGTPSQAPPSLARRSTTPAGPPAMGAAPPVPAPRAAVAPEVGQLSFVAINVKNNRGSTLGLPCFPHWLTPPRR